MKTTDKTQFRMDSVATRLPQEARQAKEARRSRSVQFVKDDDALSSYLNEIKGIKSLKLQEEKVLAARIQQGDKGALNSLVQANLKFVVAVCRNYQYQGLPLGDLINEGNLGLIRAAQRFDASLDFKFISYAVWWIRQGILTALAEQSRVLTISAGRVGMIHKIGKASRKLEQKLERPPTIEELSEAMGRSSKDITECLQLASSPLSLNAPCSGEEDGNLEECLVDENGTSTDKSAKLFLLSGNLESLLGTLDEREERVLRLYFGINGATSYTLDEIAQRFDLTRERVRQIKERALQRLRHPSRISRLEPFKG